MSSIDTAINFFVKRKFGMVADLAPALRSLMHNERNVMTEKELAIEDYKRTLRNMPESELLTLHKRTLAEDAEQARQKAIREENEHFYNLKSADADFEHWSKVDHWTIDEAIALSFGKEPDVVTRHKIEPLKDKAVFAKDFSKRRDLARRSSYVKTFGGAIPPVYFIDWANNISIELPQALVEAVEKNAGRAINWREQYIKLQQEFDDIADQTKPESTRKSENLVQALTCIAIDAYGYDPQSAKSTAPQDIANALAKRGKKVDPKTIRGWLKEGLELLPPNPDAD